MHTGHSWNRGAETRVLMRLRLTPGPVGTSTPHSWRKVGAPVRDPGVLLVKGQEAPPHRTLHAVTSNASQGSRVLGVEVAPPTPLVDHRDEAGTRIRPFASLALLATRQELAAANRGLR